MYPIILIDVIGEPGAFFLFTIVKMSKNFSAVLLFHYLVLLTKLILFKVRVGSIVYNVYYTQLTFKQSFSRSNLIPFNTIYKLLHEQIDVFVVQNILGNILGFAPLGILLPILFPSLASFKKIALAAFTLSLAYEITQLVMVLGIFDVDDIILNTLGGVVGFFIFRQFSAKKEVISSLQ